MQRIHFSVNTFEFCAHKLRAYGLKTSVYRKIYTLHGKMNELLQSRNKLYFTLVLSTVKELTHKSHKNYFFSERKAENLDTKHHFSDRICSESTEIYSHISSVAPHMIIITFYALEKSKNSNMKKVRDCTPLKTEIPI